MHGRGINDVDEKASVMPGSDVDFVSSPSAAGHVKARKPRPPKLYRMGEVVEYSGMSRQTIHNYSTMGLLPEIRWTAGGHRLYDESAFERLDLIAEMKVRNKSLQDIREIFERYDGLDAEPTPSTGSGGTPGREVAD